MGWLICQKKVVDCFRNHRSKAKLIYRRQIEGHLDNLLQVLFSGLNANVGEGVSHSITIKSKQVDYIGEARAEFNQLKNLAYFASGKTIDVVDDYEGLFL